MKISQTQTQFSLWKTLRDAKKRTGDARNTTGQLSHPNHPGRDVGVFVPVLNIKTNPKSKV